MPTVVRTILSAAVAGLLLAATQPALADGDLNKVQHVIVIMQENHSFDNYFGALAYAPGSIYHNGNGACAANDHQCVDGLICNSLGGTQSSETFTVNVSEITPYYEVNNGSWQTGSNFTVAYGSSVTLGPFPDKGGSWNWSGPNGYASTARQINNIPLSIGDNTYTATYTDKNGVQSVQSFVVTANATVAYYQVNSGSWQAGNSFTVTPGSKVNLGPGPNSGGSWSWFGANGFTATTREIDSIPLSVGVNTFVATYTDASGKQSTQTYAITANEIVPYIQINNGSWQAASTATVAAGATVNLGPQPYQSAGWSWTGSNEFSSTNRENDAVPLGNGVNTFTATYTDSKGIVSTQTFTITVNELAAYYQVNKGSWQAGNSVTVNPGDKVNLGPWPNTTSQWSWVGPQGFASTSREIDNIPLSLGVNTFTATYNGDLTCSNFNRNASGQQIFASHSGTRCIADPDHGWVAEHYKLNHENPNDSANADEDGFELWDQPLNGDETMNFYTQADIPFYYDLAQKFAISDRHFAGTAGPTFPNRAYMAAATSFGHVTTNDIVPPLGGYQPIGGSIYELLNNANVSWTDYWQDVPLDAIFDEKDVFNLTHTLPLFMFYMQAAGFGELPSVSFLDPNMGVEGGFFETDEHPPADIQKGEHYISDVINAVRNGPYWDSTVIFITYDENGGFYDHVTPPAAIQAGQRTPDGVYPGQCEDNSNPPSSLKPAGGANCTTNYVNPSGNSAATATNICPELKADPTGPFPADCAAFDYLGGRVPFLAISPFSKPGYVSHIVKDHTSIPAFIEKRFLNSEYMTNRDRYSTTMEDMFDFTNSPSRNTSLIKADSPATDCTPENGIGAWGLVVQAVKNKLSF